MFTVIAVTWITRQTTLWVRRVLHWIPAILFVYLIPALVTHSASLDLSKVYLHSLSRNWIIPLTIVIVMSALSIEQLKRVGVKPIVLFGIGSFAIATLPVLLVWLLSGISPASQQLWVEQEYWRGLVPIVGSWIGGSTSQLVLRELTHCPEPLFLSIIVLDNLLVNVWTILMFQAIKSSDSVNAMMHIESTMPAQLESSNSNRDNSIRSLVITVSPLILATVIVNILTGDFLVRIILLSFIGLALSNIISGWNFDFVIKAGSVLILIIMAILGLRLDFTSLSLPVEFVGVCVAWIAFHYIVLLFFAKVLNLHMAWAPIASMANLGGISTAPAVTAAYNKDWMPHAILLAILSMVTGNFWGIYTMYLFEQFNR